MISVKQVFDSLSGNSGLIEEFIYNNIDKSRQQYKVLSSSTVEETNMGMIPKCKNSKGEVLKVFEDKPGILVVRNGNAGKMKYLKPDKYTINDHAYILSLKKKFKIDNAINTLEEEELFLKYFIYRYQYEMYKYSTKNDNATWNKTAFFKYSEIEVPSKAVMKEVVDRYAKLLSKKKEIKKIKSKFNHLSDKVLVVDDDKELEQIELNAILAYKSRNDSLSEEGIYNFTPEKGSQNVINVLSGSTKGIYYGKISADAPKIHKLENQGLHVITRGKAGKLTYVPPGTYATNTNAFLFFIKPSARQIINVSNALEEKVYLKFLRIYLQPIFYEISSKSDVGVFPLTQMMRTLKIPHFIYNQKMVEIVDRYSKYEKYFEAIEQAEKQMDELLDKQLAF
ncbi:hypothetical protein [Priestia megaterium]|uniref:hypothetical protein n=1 Tax=Priestia megaterium TaxID=1404 RepID=UPI00301D8AA3